MSHLAKIIPACYGDLVYIARNMRALDAEEILPLTWTGKPEDLAQRISVSGGLAHVALSGVMPVATWGANMTRPNFWSVWMFTTDRWPKVALTVTRHIRNELIPALVADGAVRADCWSMEGHDVAHRWLEALGATKEATAEDYGPTRKKFHCYSWTRSRLERDGDFDYVRRTISTKNAKTAPNASNAGACGCQIRANARRSRRERSRDGNPASEAVV